MIPIMYIVLIALVALNALLLYVLYSKKEKKNTVSYKVSDVGSFYNKQTNNFLKVYGEVIQAFRTTDVTKLLDYQIKAIGFKKGQHVLDAGCGVCGPARYFAKTAGVQVEAITISQDQVDKSKDYIQKEGLEDKVNVQRGDYHHLSDYYESDSFDVVYFLESFGHAVDHEQVINEAWGILKPGGTLYIKDLFIKEPAIASLKKDIEREINNINQAYRYNVADLYEVLRFARKKGFIISKLKTIDIPLEDFENLTISNDFQKLTGINKIENLQEYVFPVDFFELKCIKPWNALEYGNSRYFLQNLYYMQVHNRKQEEL